jgi:formate dehydrogenase major subunit/formate dehydrogenase alpha subunit
MLLGNMGVPGGGVNPLRGQNNVQGACDMGGLPNVFPGYQNVTDPASQAKFEKAWGVSLSNKIGLTVTEMLKGLDTGSVRGLYVIGENPMTSDPDLNHVREAMTKSEFFVLQEIFYSETGQFADVIFQAASFVEKEGTFTNTERRIQRVRKAVPPPGEAMPDSWIVVELAERMLALGAAAPSPDAPWAGWSYAGPPAIMAEIAALTPSYAGVTYDRLNAGEQLQWPVRDASRPGTPVLHVGKFTRGLGRFVPSEHLPPNELPDDEYPLMLTTGRVIYHWRRARGLNAVYPEALIEVSPKDAQRAGVVDGDLIQLASRRGEIVAKALVTSRVGAGLVFATFHFPDSAANFLTNPALDPQAKIPEFKVCAVRLGKVVAGD